MWEADTTPAEIEQRLRAILDDYTRAQSTGDFTHAILAVHTALEDALDLKIGAGAEGLTFNEKFQRIFPKLFEQYNLVSDEYGGIDVRSPKTIGGSPVMIVLDVEDVDALFQQAVNAGASVTRPLQDSFEGKLRTGKLIDPFGHVWMITTQRGTITAE